MIYALSPSIDLKKFKEVWKTAVRRHQTLRTRLINTPFGIFQVVLDESEPLDWKEEIHIMKYLQKDKSVHMSFGDKLWRLAIVEPKETEERFFVMTVHHNHVRCFLTEFASV